MRPADPLPDGQAPGIAPMGVQADFARLLGQAVLASGHSLEVISARLREAGTPVSTATLSYWQTGRSVPARRRSMRAIEQLEALLDLPSGRLANALPRDLVLTEGAKDQILPAKDPTKVLMEQLDLHVDQTFGGVVDMARTVIRADRSELSTTADHVFQCRESGWQRLPLVYCQDSDEPAVPQVLGVWGCHLGQVLEDPAARLVVAELVLPRPMEKGELAHLGYEVAFAPSHTASFRCERALLDRHQTASITVEFLGEPPAVAERYFLPSWPDREVTTEPTPATAPRNAVPVTGRVVQWATANAEPGVHGLSWSW